MGFFGRIFRPRRKSVERMEHVRVERVFQNPYQPRRVFAPGDMGQLKQSIRSYGVLVPIVVREVKRGYELACGERRLRACRDLGLPTIPAIVRDLATPQMVELALVENLMRRDLLILEEAETFERLKREFAVTSEAELAARLGLPLEAVERYRRLAQLPMVLKKALLSSLITEQHAEILSMQADERTQLRLLGEVVQEKLTPDMLRERLAVG